MGSHIPYSVVPAIPTIQQVFLSTISPAAATSILNCASRGATLISISIIRQAFSKEKCADAGTTIFGFSTPFSVLVNLRTWMLDSVPPDVEHPPAPGSPYRSANQRIRSSSIRDVPGKRPGSPRLVSMKRLCALTATGWGMVHMDERI